MSKLNIKVSKFSNLYSFVSDLSQWGDYKYYPDRRKEWIRKTGKLSEVEKELLLDFKNIQEKIDNHLEIYFIFNNKKEIKKILKPILSAKETDSIMHILRYFEKRFNRLWNKQEKKLLYIQQNIKENIKNIDSILIDISSLCGVDYNNCNINITLLASGFSEMHGWVSENNIALECSGWKKNRIKEIIYNIIPHEIFHILIESNKNINNLIKDIAVINKENIDKKNINFGLSNKMFLEEFIISSFIPEGFLTKKHNHFHKSNIDKNDIFLNYRFFVAEKMESFAKIYVENNMTIDGNYIKKIKNTVSSFLF